MDRREHADIFSTNFYVTKREHCNLNRSHCELIRTKQHRCVLHIFESQQRFLCLDRRFIQKPNYRSFIVNRNKGLTRSDDGILVFEGEGQSRYDIVIGV